MNTGIAEAESSGFFRTSHCETSSQFIDALSRRSSAYQSAFTRAWVFRGHADDSFELIPSSLRLGSKAMEELSFHQIDTNYIQVVEEQSYLKKFLEVSDSIGLHLPEDTQTLRRWLEQPLPKNTAWPPNELLSIMALAQHHGLPTRLLDWSRNPLKAAWFAADEASKIEDKSGNLSVWALSIELLEVLKGEPKPFIIVTAPSATNSNLRAQEGVFTLGRHVLTDESPIDRTPFDELLRASFERYDVNAPGPWFHRVTLPKSQATELAFDLALEGITRAALFPDFYGVVQSIKDGIRWQKNDGPGARRAAQRLESFVLSHKSEISLESLGIERPPSPNSI